jgi:hypothetical protein
MEGTDAPRVIEIKRQLDRDFYCAAPIFSDAIGQSYREFTERCFDTFGLWGADARLRTGFGRRRQAFGAAWNSEWETMFSYDGMAEITGAELTGIRDSYNNLIATFANDIELNQARTRYVPAEVAINAH